MIEFIVEERCTGCNACVAACPSHVLDASPVGAPAIARPDQCQTCFMCELYCEADAIWVGPDKDVRGAADEASVLASGQLGRMRRDYGWSPDSEPRPLREYWRLGPLLNEGAQIAARRYARAHPSPPGDGQND
jgi:NAD-dependent dihydropyrimidine dehydrogenase PreA subunit